MNYLKLILPLLLCALSLLQTAETRRLADDAEPGSNVYSVARVNDYRQLSFKADALNLQVRNGVRDQLEIVFVVKERKNSKERKDALAYLSSFAKNRPQLKEAGNHNLNGLEEVKISENGQELLVSARNDYKKYATYALVLLPPGLSLQAELKAGEIDLAKISSEILIKNTDGSTKISDCNGVLTFNGKSGSLNVSGFQGVLQASLLTGSLKFDLFDGDLTVKLTNGSCRMDKFSGRLKLNSKVGSADLRNISKSDLVIKNVSGDIAIRHVSEGGNVEISNETGDISIRDSHMKKVSIKQSGGDIDLENVNAVMNISSKAGDITVETDELFLAEDNKIDLSFGDVELKLKKPQDYDYYKKSSGEARYDFADEIEVDDYLRIARSGKKGKTLEISVGMGSITVK